jgi:hypothetical protein
MKSRSEDCTATEKVMTVKAILQIATALFLLAICSVSLRTAAAQRDKLVIKGDGSTFAYPM